MRLELTALQVLPALADWFGPDAAVDGQNAKA